MCNIATIVHQFAVAVVGTALTAVALSALAPAQAAGRVIPEAMKSSAWREDNRRVSNGDQMSRVARWQ
jgi:hypothetical protein